MIRLTIQIDEAVYGIGWIDAQQKQVLLNSAVVRWREDVCACAPSLCLLCEGASPDAVLAQLADELHGMGHIGWRGELYAVREETKDEPIALIERAAAKFLGLKTVGAHCNGFIVDHRGRPSHLWVGKRASSKATDPGLLDNLVGCGVPWPQTPDEAVIREGWEEAGLSASCMQQALLRNVYQVDRQDADGQHRQRLYVYDLALPREVEPQNQDGEVDAYLLLAIQEIVVGLKMARFTADAAITTLDFLQRHALIGTPSPENGLDEVWRRSVGAVSTCGSGR
ncbi:DUF4743 domain-containing protein [Leptothrix ochracea]|uniref:NUDIX hydrolase n=1 Tax=Leptothrix ochracea TaxID=735331 RepID=UPI0034E29610